MAYSMFGGYNPYSFGGGFGGGYNPYSFGGGFGGMGGFGGGYNPYSFGGGFGGYDPYGLFGGGYGGFGGGYNDFFGKLFSQYFDQSGAVTEDSPAVESIDAEYADEQPIDSPAGNEPAASEEPETTTRRAGESTVGPSTRPYADISGKYYGKTGKLSKGAEQKVIDAYGSVDAFWESNQGQQLQAQADRRRRGGRDKDKSSF